MKRYLFSAVLAVLLFSACQKQDETQTQCEQGNYNSCYAYGLKFSRGTGVTKDIHKALNYFEKACGGTVARACSHIGFLYQTGQGVDKNYTTSIQYYEKGCRLGDIGGCNNAG
ncbi:MAG: sel1 repeat family protein, partial [Neisseriaceae bacterium]|nr:sel1 repeat family protein [Neisseriaceae bacterium]